MTYENIVQLVNREPLKSLSLMFQTIALRGKGIFPLSINIRGTVNHLGFRHILFAGLELSNQHVFIPCHNWNCLFDYILYI